MMINIAFITSNTQDAGSSRLRVYRLAEALRKKGVTVSINTSVDKADIIIFQKSNFFYLLRYFIKYMLSTKILVFDIDDLWNGPYLFFVKYCNAVITSTQFLKEQYIHLNRNIYVIDNILDIDNINIELAHVKTQYQRFASFGTEENIKLLDTLKLDNITKITKNGDIEWNKDTIDSVLQSFDFLIITLGNDDMALAKTNNRFLKTLYLGVPALVSDVPEYRKLALYVNYPLDFLCDFSSVSWNTKIEMLKSGKLIFNYNFSEARKLILKKYSSENIAYQFVQIIPFLMYTKRYKYRILLALIFNWQIYKFTFIKCLRKIRRGIK